MRFIKLSNMIINASKIVSIEKSPDKYKIIMGHQELSGLLLVGSGFISSQLCEYDIFKKENCKDYEIIEKIIDAYDVTKKPLTYVNVPDGISS